MIDRFDGAALDPRWTWVSGGATSQLTVAGGVARVTYANDEGAFFYLNTPLSIDASWSIDIKARIPAGPVGWPLFMTRGFPAVNSGNEALRVSRKASPADQLALEYYRVYGGRTTWDGPSQAWSMSGDVGAGVNFRLNDWAHVVIQNDGPGQRFRFAALGADQPYTTSNGGEILSALTDWVPWSAVSGSGSDVYLVCGGMLGLLGYEAEFSYCRLTQGGPIAATTDVRTTSGSYRVHRVVAYADDLSEFPLFLPEDRAHAPWIDAETWHPTSARHAHSSLGPDGKVYTLFSGTNGSTVDMGIRESADMFSPFIKQPAPFIPTGEPGEPAGPYSGAGFWYDLDAAEWKLLQGVFDNATSRFSIHLYTTQSAVPYTGWTYQYEVAAPTGSGWNEEGVQSSRLFHDGTQYILFVGGFRTSHPNWTFGLYTGPSLDAMVPVAAPLFDGAGAPATTITGSVTDSNLLPVADSSGFVAGAPVVITDDNNAGTWLFARIQSVTTGVIALDQNVSIGSGFVNQWDHQRIDCRAVVPPGAPGNPSANWLAILTAFGAFHGIPGAEGVTESNVYATAPAASGPWTLHLGDSPAAPMRGNFAGSPGMARSLENMNLLDRPIASGESPVGPPPPPPATHVSPPITVQFVPGQAYSIVVNANGDVEIS